MKQAMRFYREQPERERARKIVEEEYGSYEPNDGDPDCIFRSHEDEYGPCGGVTYSDDFSVPLGTYAGTNFDGIKIPVPLCTAHHDVFKGQIPRSDHVFRY